MKQLQLNAAYYPPQKAYNDLLNTIIRLQALRDEAYNANNLERANRVGAQLDLLVALKDIINTQSAMIAANAVTDDRMEIKKLNKTIRALRVFIQANGLNPNSIYNYHGDC